MGSRLSAMAALLLGFLLTALPGPSAVLAQDLRETDALCMAEGCLALHFQRKTFLDSWRSCREGGGDLATIKRKEDAGIIGRLLASADLRHSRTKVRVWIGLQRQPRQCSATLPLRGFSWTTGDQDTDYTNWQGKDSPGACSAPRCVVIAYDALKRSDNLKWEDGPCVAPADGYLCHHGFRGMCPALGSEGAGKVLYVTPFHLLSTLLTHAPPGTVATLPCPSGAERESSVLCEPRDDGLAGWSREPPLCSDPPLSHNWCRVDNGGCEHFCREAAANFYCECAEGYQLEENGQNCELLDVCEGAPCGFECLPLSDSYRCACPDGYMLAPDELNCVDVDECLQSPCEHLCVNSLGSFGCRCREGYLLDEHGACEDTDECMANPCEHACENTAGSHICHCHLGFSPVPEDPSRCQDTDECRMAGTCQQICLNFEGSFQCYCEEGYHLLSDMYSCEKVEHDYGQFAVTPTFAWATPQPGPPLGTDDYDWPNTDWPPEEELFPEWLTDPPKSAKPGVLRVSPDPSAQKPVKDDPVGEVDLTPVEPTSPTTEPRLMTTSHWYEDGDEDEATAAPQLSPTFALSEGVQDWWKGATTSRPNTNNPEGWAPSTAPGSNGNVEYHPRRRPPGLLEQGDPLDGLRVHTTAIPTRDPPGQSTTGGVGGAGEVVLEESGRDQRHAWLLLATLVPVSVLVVLMVLLGIACCTCYGGRPRHKKTADCYHWVSGAHHKQGAPGSSPGVTSCV